MKHFSRKSSFSRPSFLRRADDLRPGENYEQPFRLSSSRDRGGIATDAGKSNDDTCSNLSKTIFPLFVPLAPLPLIYQPRRTCHLSPTRQSTYSAIEYAEAQHQARSIPTFRSVNRPRPRLINRTRHAISPSRKVESRATSKERRKSRVVQGQSSWKKIAFHPPTPPRCV